MSTAGINHATVTVESVEPSEVDEEFENDQRIKENNVFRKRPMKDEIVFMQHPRSGNTMAHNSAKRKRSIDTLANDASVGFGDGLSS